MDHQARQGKGKPEAEEQGGLSKAPYGRPRLDAFLQVPVVEAQVFEGLEVGSHRVHELAHPGKILNLGVALREAAGELHPLREGDLRWLV